MITIGLCLIYYGLALWGYQLYSWYAYGEWSPYPVEAAWRAFFGRFYIQDPFLRPIVEWLMNWPLSLALIILGSLILLSVTAVREMLKARVQRVRLIWVERQAAAAGYEPWTISKTVEDFKKTVIEGEENERTRLR